jgi:hypothetical protein
MIVARREDRFLIAPIASEEEAVLMRYSTSSLRGDEMKDDQEHPGQSSYRVILYCLHLMASVFRIHD